MNEFEKKDIKAQLYWNYLMIVRIYREIGVYLRGLEEEHKPDAIPEQPELPIEETETDTKMPTRIFVYMHKLRVKLEGKNFVNYRNKKEAYQAISRTFLEPGDALPTFHPEKGEPYGKFLKNLFSEVSVRAGRPKVETLILYRKDGTEEVF